MKYEKLRKITNFRYYANIQILKQQNVDQEQIKILDDQFFSRIGLYYVDLHIDGIMTESVVNLIERNCKQIQSIKYK